MRHHWKERETNAAMWWRLLRCGSATTSMSGESHSSICGILAQPFEDSNKKDQGTLYSSGQVAL